MKKNLYIILIAFVFSSILWISITLSEEYYSTYKIPIRTIDLPDGYSLASELPSYLSVKIKGIGWRLTGIAIGSESFFNVSAKNDSGRILANLFANVIENPWLSSDISVIDIVPDTISFLVERVISKRVPVVPSLDLSFKPGFGLGTKVSVIPDSVTVFGPKSLISKLDSVFTAPVKLSGLDAHTIVKASFKNELYNTNITAVDVTLDVQRIVDKNIDNIKVEVLDVPTDRDVVLLPNNVSCLIKGGINLIGKMSENDFRSFVNYRDILLDTLGSVEPVIELPDNVELVSVKPGRLRYIIKKFN